MSVIFSLTSANAIKTILLRNMRRSSPQANDVVSQYRAPNGRRFNLFHDGRHYYLGEAVPNGLRKEYGREDHIPYFVADPEIYRLLEEVDPNSFQSRLQELGLRDKDVVRTYEVLERDIAQQFLEAFDDLDQVVDEVLDALERNEWLDADRFSPSLNNEQRPSPGRF